MKEDSKELEKGAILTQEYISEHDKKHHRSKKNTHFACGIIIGALAIALLVVLVTVHITYQNIEKEADDAHRNAEISKVGEATEGNIDMSTLESEELLVTKAGTYTIMGSADKRIKIEADGEVVLQLANVALNSVNSPVIENINQTPLTIELIDDTSNYLTASGVAVAAIRSAGPLTITSETGTLIIDDQTRAGVAINIEYAANDTIEGYVTDGTYLIDGGLIVVFSNHNIAQPSSVSQPAFIFANTNLSTGDYSIADEEKSLITVSTLKTFKSIMFSSAELSTEKTYHLVRETEQ